MRKSLLLVYPLLALAVTACGSPGNPAHGQPTTTATPQAVAGVTQADVIAVAQQVYPRQSGAYGVCGANLDFAACPYSERLKARLTELKQTLCRCQNPSTTFQASAELLGSGTGIAHVALFQGRVNFDLWVTTQNGRLVVDDQICAGRKDTSIYATPVVACAA